MDITYNIVCRAVFIVCFGCISQALVFAELHSANYSANHSANQCNQWFYNAHLSTSPRCLRECTLLPIDSTTAECPQFCSQFCNTPLPKFKERRGRINAFFSNKSLVLLAFKHPFRMYQAYQLSVKARNLCFHHFPGKKSMQYDACRHFIWSAFLYEQFGFWFSEQILYNFERNSNQPNWQLKMDMTNNLLGISTAKYLLAIDQFSEVNLIKHFYQKLDNNLIMTVE